MPSTDFSDIRSITDFPSLIRYLRTDLGWPVDEEQADDLTFEYRPSELGLDDAAAVKIREIKQLRPLAGNQPWGIFWIDFEPKSLPVLVMRRILNRLVQKQRGQASSQKTWNLRDLLFISATGAGSERGISFAHFEQAGEREQLRTFSWDVRETHLFYIKNLKLGQLHWPTNPADAQAWRAQWSAAFTVEHRYVVKTAQQLAGEMARMAGEIREAVDALYAAEHSGGPLHQLHLSLKMTLITDLSEADFADMYAQTVAYGLFAARATHQGEFAAANDGVEALIAHTNPFLRELLGQLMNQKDMDFDGLGVNELVDLLRQVNMEEILMDFGRQKRGEDPVIHFYETFMKQYDPVQKTRRGEFYTPDAAVSFIVRSVDFLLRRDFNCPDGLMSSLSTDGGFAPIVLDPATGTGTFLRYVILVVYESFCQKYKRLKKDELRAKWNEYVRESLLPRLYAFELKMSPYTIAHLKLGLTLQEAGFEFQEGERLRVFLSNALQPAHEVARVDTPALAHEVERANEVKARVPVTVVIGNPPYAGHSSNASRDHQGDLNFIGNLLQDYYKVDGKPLGEKNPKWLQDDYVKFMRFAQWRVNESGAGIVAMITNHGYLDNPTFRGMRQQLMQTFSEIYVLDLHGNSKKQETAPDGSKDENVFDIMQGVAICLMVKKPGATGLAKVFHADLFGLREFKYEWLMAHHSHMGSVEWNELTPKTPHYLFSPQDADLGSEYDLGWKITEIMPANSVGLVTARDNLAIQSTPEKVYETILDFSSLPIEKAREKYSLGSDARDWKVSLAQQDILKSGTDKAKVIPILYRPFDIRFTYYTGQSRGFICMPRPEIMGQMIAGENLGLIIPRRVEISGGWQHVLVSRNIVDHVVVSSKTIDLLLPVYTYPNQTHVSQLSLLDAVSGNNRVANLSSTFLKFISQKLNLKFIPDGTGNLTSTFGPENVFHYIYAVFHSPAYRQRYAEFLKIDFPRVPLTGNVALFRQLCGLGRELVGWHLLENSQKSKVEGQGQFVGGKERATVEKGYPKYTAGAVFINPNSSFVGVSEEVWNFHIGGYQVCEKWLKDRRGRELSAEDVVHYQKIVVALGETIRLMGLVDEAIESAGGWPVR